MNALEQIIESGVATAAIVEDDIDWDVRLKDQMRDLALATQTLIQPIESNSIFRDLYPGLPTRMAFEDMPAVEMPMSGSPYGDFDVLWLGYCRMVVETHTSETNHIIYRANDSSVPDREWLRNNGFLGHGLLLQDMPEHTRIYHHVRDGLCSLFYAVSASAARKIYHEFSEVLLYAPFDVMLMHYCNLGARPEPGTKESLKCFAATPQLFNHWRSGNNASENIRWSARLNIEKLRTGSEDDFVDSWPDHEQDG